MKLKTSLASLAVLAAAGTAQAHQAGDFIVRAGVANVSPDASSSELSLNGGAIAGSSADVKDNTQLGLTFTYMLSDDWGIEALASTPFSHDITADTGALGLGTIDAGSTKHLPPTISLQWYPAASDNKWQPYVGAGVNYTHFFGTDVDSELEAVLGRGDLDLKDSFGLSAQFGVDYKINDNLLKNLAVWYIDLETEAEF